MPSITSSLVEDLSMRVGICGLGDRMGYLANVFPKVIPDFNLVAYADPSPTGFRRLSQDQIRKMNSYENLQPMLDKENLDLVMIGSPNLFHCDQLCTALDNGLKIFCEKPIVTTEDETFRLLAELRKHGSDQVMVGLVLRYAPLYQDLVELAQGDKLGSIISIEASEHIPPVHGAFFFRDWRRKTSMSGGFMLEKCCHDLDLYAGLVQARPRKVASFGGRSFFDEQNKDLDGEHVYNRWPATWNRTESSFSGDTDIVDHQVALIEYCNGVRLCFHTNVHTPDAFRRFCVIGSKGMAEGDFVRGFLKVHNAISRECILDSSYKNEGMSMHYGAEEKMANDLSEHLYKGTPLPVSVLDALEAGLTAIKIDQSRESGQVLDLTELWQRFDTTVGL